MPIDEEAAKDTESEAMFRMPTRPGQDQGSESTGRASPPQPLPPPPPPSSAPPRLQGTRALSPSSATSSDWSDSSAGQEPGYQRLSSSQQSSTTLESEAVFRPPARPGQDQGSESTGRASPPQPLSAPPRLQGTPDHDYALSPSSITSSDWSDSSAGCSPIGLCTAVQEPVYQRLSSSQQSSTTLSEESDAASPVKSPRLESWQSSESSKDDPSPAQQAYSMATYRNKLRKRLEYRYRQVSAQNLDVTTDSEVSLVSRSSEMQQETGDGVEAAAAGDTELDADLSFYAKAVTSSANTETFSGTVTTTASIQNEPVEQTRDLLVPTEEAVLPMETAAMFGSATPQLVELRPTEAATPQSVPPSIGTSTAGSAMSQLVELVSTDGATSQSVQSIATDSVGSAKQQLVESGLSDETAWQSVQSSSIPLNLMPASGTVNPTVSWLPTAHLTNKIPGTEQNTNVWTPGTTSPIESATVGSAIPRLIQDDEATWQSLLSPNASPFNFLSTNEALNPTVSLLPMTCVPFVLPTAPVTYQQPSTRLSAMRSAPFIRTTDLLTGSPYGVNPYSPVQSLNPTMLGTSSPQVRDIGNRYSLEVPGSQQTTSAVRAIAVGSAMAETTGSAARVETTYSASNFLCLGSSDWSAVTAPIDSSISASKSSKLTKTPTPILEKSMMSNLANFRASTAAHKEPITSTGMNVSGRAATNEAKTTVGDERTLSVSSVLEKTLIKKQTCHPLDASLEILQLPKLTVNRAGPPSDLNESVVESQETRTQTAATSSSVEVSMLSNIAEFRASTGARKEVTKKIQNTVASNTTGEKDAAVPVTKKSESTEGRKKEL